MRTDSGRDAEQIVKQIYESKALLEQTEKAMKEPGRFLDLTCKLQLRDDCSALRKKLKKLKPDKMTMEELEALRLMTIRLQTTAENILK